MKIYKNLAFILSVVGIVFVMVYFIASTFQHEYFQPFGVVRGYSFTSASEKTRLGISVLADKNNGKLTQKENFAEMVLIAGGERYAVELDGEIQVLPEMAGVYQGRAVYELFLPIAVYTSAGMEMPDAILEIQLKSGETVQICVGDISFQLVNFEENSYDEIRFAGISPIGSSDEQDRYVLHAIALELELQEDIRLSAIDFGLTGYGVNSEELLSFFGDDRIRAAKKELEETETFFETHKNLKNIEYQAAPESAVDLVLEKGRHLLIVPISRTEKTRIQEILLTGARLQYTGKPGENTFTVDAKLLFQEGAYSETMIKEMMGYAETNTNN